jgi:type I restriction enzyme S subunit
MAGEERATVYGNFAADFVEDRLADLCDPDAGIQTGPFGSQLHQEDYVTVGTPIITVEHLGENRILHEGVPRVSDVDRERLSRYSLRMGDIVFSRVGSVDRRALVRHAEDGWLFSGRCLRVRPNTERIDSGFLSYFFGLPAFKEHIRSIAVGATMPSLNTSILSNIVIPHMRDIGEQRAIAHILGSLDDKIELNRQMNETLEAIARAIFKSWFVDFDPVRAKAAGRDPGLPKHIADLFSDSFEDSELGEIPKGWEARKLGDLLEFAYGKALKAEDRREGNVPVYGSNGQVGWHDEPLATGPGIIVGRKGNPGIATWAPTDFFAIDTAFYVVPKQVCCSLHFLFHVLQTHNLASLGADSAVLMNVKHYSRPTTIKIPDSVRTSFSSPKG